MNVHHLCDIPRDTGYSNVCHICGVPSDAGYFDVASIKKAPGAGEEVELARYELHSQYCGSLLYFAQFADEQGLNRQVISHTPGYEWIILCNNQPRAPYLPTSLILNPWGYNAFPIQLRLEEGCTVRFVVRRVAPSVEDELSHVGGRLMGRSWYNTIMAVHPIDYERDALCHPTTLRLHRTAAFRTLISASIVPHTVARLPPSGEIKVSKFA